MAESDYEVGYKKPPKAHRFKPGQSGNPRGRPKGSRSLGEEVRAALGKRITITEDGQRRSITVLEAALKRLAERAIKSGDLRAIRHLLALAEAYPERVVAEALSADDQHLLDQTLARLKGEE